MAVIKPLRVASIYILYRHPWDIVNFSTESRVWNLPPGLSNPALRAPHQRSTANPRLV